MVMKEVNFIELLRILWFKVLIVIVISFDYFKVKRNVIKSYVKDDVNEMLYFFFFLV